MSELNFSTYRGRNTAGLPPGVVHISAPHSKEPEAQNIEFARRYLSILDPTTTKFTFQTFDDNADRKSRELALILNGSLDEHWHRLVELNNKGAGVYVTVQQTNGGGRKNTNIIRLRAVFRENDHQEAPVLPTQPHMVVESSPGKTHEYILTDAPMDQADAFTGVMERLVADYGSDPNAKDLARVLRVPGFFHQKASKRKGQTGAKHLVTIAHESGEPPLPWGAVVETFPPVSKAKREAVQRFVAGETSPGDGTIVKIAEVSQALDHLDPERPYEEWLKILMAVHHASAGGKEGLDLADSWSQRGASYKQHETRYRWGTFGHYQAGSQATSATLFKLAYGEGWKGLRYKNEEDERLITLQRNRLLDDFDRYHGVVKINGKTLIVSRKYNEQLKCRETEFSTQQDLQLFYANQTLPNVVEMPQGGKRLDNKAPIFAAWTKRRTRRTYQSAVMDPQPGILSSRDGALPTSTDYNLYQGWTISPAPGDCQLVLDHIFKVWCDSNEESYTYVLGWLACLIQKPDQPGHTAIVLKSGQGSGKNIITDRFDELFGVNGITVSRGEDVVGRFTDHLATSVFVCLNEAVWGGNKQQEGAFKQLATDPTLTVERKFCPKFQVRNCCHVMIPTNSEWAVPVGIDDRRVVMLRVSDAQRDNRAYFKRLAEHMDNGGFAAFIHYLLHLDISRFDPRRLPAGDAETKLETKTRTADTVDQWIISCLREGEIQGDTGEHGKEELFDLAKGWKEEGVWISTDDLDRAYRGWVKRRGAGRCLSKSFLVKRLAELTGAKKVRATSGERKNGYSIPPLLSAVCDGEKALKQKIPHEHGEICPTWMN